MGPYRRLLLPAWRHRRSERKPAAGTLNHSQMVTAPKEHCDCTRHEADEHTCESTPSDLFAACPQRTSLIYVCVATAQVNTKLTGGGGGGSDRCPQCPTCPQCAAQGIADSSPAVAVAVAEGVLLGVMVLGGMLGCVPAPSATNCKRLRSPCPRFLF